MIVPKAITDISTILRSVSLNPNTARESALHFKTCKHSHTFPNEEVTRDKTKTDKNTSMEFQTLTLFSSISCQVVETLLTSGRGCNSRTRDDLETRRKRRHGGTPEDTEGTLGDATTRVIFLPQNAQQRDSYLWHFFFLSLSTAGPECSLMTLEEKGGKGELTEQRKG